MDPALLADPGRFQWDPRYTDNHDPAIRELEDEFTITVAMATFLKHQGRYLNLT
jgi:hypothetical protein